MDQTKTDGSKSLFSRIKGNNMKEYVENVSFMIIVISSLMVATGMFVGSFVQGTIFIASFGSVFVLVGITVYITSQFIGVNNG